MAIESLALDMLMRSAPELREALHDEEVRLITILSDGRWLSAAKDKLVMRMHTLEPKLVHALKHAAQDQNTHTHYKERWVLTTLEGSQGPMFTFERIPHPQTTRILRQLPDTLHASLEQLSIDRANVLVVGPSSAKNLDLLASVASTSNADSAVLISNMPLHHTQLDESILHLYPPRDLETARRMERTLTHYEAVFWHGMNTLQDLITSAHTAYTRGRWWHIHAFDPEHGLSTLASWFGQTIPLELDAILALAYDPGLSVTHLLQRDERGRWREHINKSTALAQYTTSLFPSPSAVQPRHAHTHLEHLEHQATTYTPDFQLPKFKTKPHEHTDHTVQRARTIERPVVPATLKKSALPLDQASSALQELLEDSEAPQDIGMILNPEEISESAHSSHKSQPSTSHFNIEKEAQHIPEEHANEHLEEMIRELDEDHKPTIIKTPPTNAPISDEHSHEHSNDICSDNTAEDPLRRTAYSAPGPAVRAILDANLSQDEDDEATQGIDVRELLEAARDDLHAAESMAESMYSPSQAKYLSHPQKHIDQDAITSNVSSKELDEVLSNFKDSPDEELSDALFYAKRHSAPTAFEETTRSAPPPLPMHPEDVIDSAEPAESAEPVASVNKHNTTMTPFHNPIKPLSWDDDEVTTQRDPSEFLTSNTFKKDAKKEPKAASNEDPTTSSSVKLSALSLKLKALRERRRQGSNDEHD